MPVHKYLPLCRIIGIFHQVLCSGKLENTQNLQLVNLHARALLKYFISSILLITEKAQIFDFNKEINLRSNSSVSESSGNEISCFKTLYLLWFNHFNFTTCVFPSIIPTSFSSRHILLLFIIFSYHLLLSKLLFRRAISVLINDIFLLKEKSLFYNPHTSGVLQHIALLYFGAIPVTRTMSYNG